MENYNSIKIEKKWQSYWTKQKTFRAENGGSRPKFYALDMFPYPSGAGLHVGHPLGYIASDIVSRYKRHRGFNVLHPMGWDAFGLPAERYAMQTGIHPSVTTQNNVANFKRQIKMLGLSYDWTREINTTDPRYYKWTQWIFLKLFERGLAYEADMPINWCPSCKTGLANEEVIDGRLLDRQGERRRPEGEPPLQRDRRHLLEDLALVLDCGPAELDDEDLAHVVYSEFSMTYSSVRSQPKASPIPLPSPRSSRRRVSGLSSAARAAARSKASAGLVSAKW